MQLPLKQLEGLSRQLSTELNTLRQNLAALASARQRFNESMRGLDTVGGSKAGNPMMVPLTLSMYAPGKLKTPDFVTVDIGTGYFVKKTIPEAKAFVDRKLKFLDGNIQGIEKEVTIKRRNLEGVVGVMQQKVKMTQQQVASQVAQ